MLEPCRNADGFADKTAGPFVGLACGKFIFAIVWLAVTDGTPVGPSSGEWKLSGLVYAFT